MKPLLEQYPSALIEEGVASQGISAICGPLNRAVKATPDAAVACYREYAGTPGYAGIALDPSRPSCAELGASPAVARSDPPPPIPPAQSRPRALEVPPTSRHLAHSAPHCEGLPAVAHHSSAECTVRLPLWLPGHDAMAVAYAKLRPSRRPHYPDATQPWAVGALPLPSGRIAQIARNPPCERTDQRTRASTATS